MEKNIAVIGCGYWGQNLVRNFSELGALHTICDSNTGILTRLKEKYSGINFETKLKSVLASKEVKGVIIASPAVSHYSMAREALLSGKDVLVEKPLALSVKEGEELVALARSRGRILMVGHLLEYHPGVTEVKRLVDSGELGKINYIYSNRLNLGKFRTEENILWSFAPHDISIILLILNEMPESVSAHGGNYLHRDIADVTVTNMSFRSGARAHIFVSWLHPYKEQKLVVIGDKKMAVFDDVSPEHKLKLYELRIEWIDRSPVPNWQDATPVEFNMREPLKLECQHFIECMASREKPRTDGESGLRVLRVLDACQKSLQNGGTNVPLAAMGNIYVHASSLVESPSSIGENTRIWHFCHIMPHTVIGKDCTIGQNVFIGSNVNIGNNVKIENNVSLFDGVTLEDDVFCGPSCVFTNVKNPRSHLSQKDRFAPTLVKTGATIGANATIVCGHTIGRYAFIGAGAVVTRGVPDYALVHGNPARLQGWVCECGRSLDFGQDDQVECRRCRKRYTRRVVAGELQVRGVAL